MKQYDVISFGETMLRLSPPPLTRLEDTKSLNLYVGGSESNVLACLARLGLRCGWLSALPANPLGRQVTGELQRHGVDTRHVIWTDAAARLGIFYAEEGAAPLGSNVYYDRANSACALIDPDQLDLTVVGETRLLHLSGITPALGDHARVVLERLIDRARALDVPIAFDVNYRAKLWNAKSAAAGIEEACRAADLLFCTRQDAAELWGMSGSVEDMLRQIAQRFGGNKPQQTIVLTLGGEGSAQIHQGLVESAPPFASAGTVRFGSGDAFAAGYLYAYLDGPLYRRMHEEMGVHPLAWGNAAAALKRCIPGDIAVITPDEILALLRGGQNQRFR